MATTRHDEPRDAVVLDLDGALCDTSSVEHLIEDADFATFQEAAVGCPPDPELVEVARQQAAARRAVLIVSGREFIWHDHTLDWLVEHEIPHDAVYLRVVGDYRKDIVIKAEILQQIGADGYRVLEAWDDKPRVVEMWREKGITGHLVGG